MSVLTARPCKVCTVEKPANQYPKGAGQYTCKSCKAEQTRQYILSLDPDVRRERERNHGIWKRYRLRPEQYSELTKDGCAICGTKEGLCIDHDHSCCPGSRTCGKCVRGALCQKHNRGEACFEDLDEIMELLAYRMKYAQKEENTSVTAN